jgi:hypothetical protein
MIPQFVMPLLFLLLQRDFEIFRIAQTRVLHPDELWDASETCDFFIPRKLMLTHSIIRIKYVIEAVDERVNTLKCICPLLFCFQHLTIFPSYLSAAETGSDPAIQVVWAWYRQSFTYCWVSWLG